MKTIEWKKDNASYAHDLIGYVDEQKAFHIAFYDVSSFYGAYFLPKKWCNFGNAVRHTIGGECTKYKTLDAAKEDCEKHLDAFGLKPDSNCSLEKKESSDVQTNA